MQPRDLKPPSLQPHEVPEGQTSSDAGPSAPAAAQGRANFVAMNIGARTYEKDSTKECEEQTQNLARTTCIPGGGQHGRVADWGVEASGQLSVAVGLAHMVETQSPASSTTTGPGKRQRVIQREHEDTSGARMPTPKRAPPAARGSEEAAPYAAPVSP